MGVFIKGMEMPKGSCEWVDKDGHLHRCKLLNGDDDCKMQAGICADATWEEQFANCPLVEVPPHGRLIDADFEEAHYTSMTVNPTPDVTKQDKRNSLIIIEALQKAKTIIEPEGSEET